MINKSTLKSLFYYQKERFPVLIIGLSLIPVVLSSSTVTFSSISIYTLFVILLASITYLLHVRILDERRDFLHDSKFHKDRPLQNGTITLPALLKIDRAAMAIFIISSLEVGLQTVLLSFYMLLYSWLAERNFFKPKLFKRHFLIYNLLNTIQTLLLQIFVYAAFFPFNISSLVYYHFVFTSLGTFIYEFARKLKIPGEDGKGKDTYTFHIGFRNSILIYLLLSILCLIFFLLLVRQLSFLSIYVFFASVSFIFIIATAILHLKFRTQTTQNLMQSSFILFYLAGNIFVYIWN